MEIIGRLKSFYMNKALFLRVKTKLLALALIILIIAAYILSKVKI